MGRACVGEGLDDDDDDDVDDAGLCARMQGSVVMGGAEHGRNSRGYSGAGETRRVLAGF